MQTFWSTLHLSAVPPAMLVAAGLVALVILVGSVLAVWRWRRRGAAEPTPTRPSATAPESSYGRLRRGLARTRADIFGALSSVLAGRTLDAAAVESLETALIRADVGVA